jgi:uncharacterized protein YbjT (DUF2867 family)
MPPRRFAMVDRPPRQLALGMTTNLIDTATTLVIGGTGKTGRRVAERLSASGLLVRVGSRSGDPAFDWDDESTWKPALRGVRAAYLTYAPDLGLPGAAEQVRALADLAVSGGTRRLVLLSGRGQDGHAPAERAVQESGADWTIVRAAWFAQNFSEGFLTRPVRDGVLALPAGDAAEPFVDAADVADVAVAALTDDRYAGQVYEVTGPRLVTFEAAADEIALAIGRPIRYHPITSQDFTAGMTEAGLPSGLVAVLAEVFAELRSGRNASTADGVERALGRPPRDFAAFARTTAATGVWRP